MKKYKKGVLGVLGLSVVAGSILSGCGVDDKDVANSYKESKISSDESLIGTQVIKDKDIDNYKVYSADYQDITIVPYIKEQLGYSYNINYDITGYVDKLSREDMPDGEGGLGNLSNEDYNAYYDMVKTKLIDNAMYKDALNVNQKDLDKFYKDNSYTYDVLIIAYKRDAYKNSSKKRAYIDKTLKQFKKIGTYREFQTLLSSLDGHEKYLEGENLYLNEYSFKGKELGEDILKLKVGEQITVENSKDSLAIYKLIGKKKSEPFDPINTYLIDKLEEQKLSTDYDVLRKISDEESSKKEVPFKLSKKMLKEIKTEVLNRAKIEEKAGEGTEEESTPEE